MAPSVGKNRAKTLMLPKQKSEIREFSGDSTTADHLPGPPNTAVLAAQHGDTHGSKIQIPKLSISQFLPSTLSEIPTSTRHPSSLADIHHSRPSMLPAPRLKFGSLSFYSHLSDKFLTIQISNSQQPKKGPPRRFQFRRALPQSPNRQISTNAMMNQSAEEEDIYNIIPVHNLLADHPSLRFPEMRAAAATLRSAGDLCRPPLSRHGRRCTAFSAALRI